MPAFPSGRPQMFYQCLLKGIFDLAANLRAADYSKALKDRGDAIIDMPEQLQGLAPAPAPRDLDVDGEPLGLSVCSAKMCSE